MNKKYEIIIFIALIIVSLFSCTSVFATENTTEFFGGDGTESNPYIIGKKEHLNNVRKYPDAYFELVVDLTFDEADFADGGAFYNNGKGWSPIGNNEIPFTGTFDGNGHCINDLSISGNMTETPYVGLFGYNKGFIKNIISISGQIAGTHASNTIYVGMIAGYSEGVIENCKSIGAINVESTILRATYEPSCSYVGGITGCSVGTLSFCENTCDIQATPSVIANAEAIVYLGGVAGSANASTVSNCINSGTITQTPTLDTDTGIIVYAGGISGQSNSNITGCDNRGSVIIEEFTAGSTSNVSISANFYAAGIIGYSTGTITDSNNSGTVRARGVYAYSGGIAAYNTGTLSQCRNNGNIMAITTDTGSSDYSHGYSGGIVGYSTGTTSESYNTGFVEVSEACASEAGYSGGIVSYQKGGTIVNCYNAGYLPDKTYYGDTGGIAGYSSGSISLCYNIGRVPEGYPRGGGAIVGYTSQITTNCFFLNDNKVGVAKGKDSTISYSKEEFLLTETYAGFDFNSVWEIGVYDNYPCATLKNVEHKGSIIGNDLFADGTGTVYDPFLIENAEQLNNVRVIPSAYYELIADIAFKNSDYAEGGTFYNDGEGWLPIMYFVGSFDGCGHVISNLQIQHAPTSHRTSNEKYARLYDDYFGLFGYNCGGTISRVGVTGNIYVKRFNRPYVLDHAYVGGIAGGSNGTINECYFIGNVYGSAEKYQNIGGICGWSWDPEGTIENCFSKGTFTGTSTKDVGGITGSGSYLNCYSIGRVVKNNSSTNIAIVKGRGSIIDCTDAEMLIKDTYVDFDFEKDWIILPGSYSYPQLRRNLVTSIKSIYIAEQPSKPINCIKGRFASYNGLKLGILFNDGSSIEIEPWAECFSMLDVSLNGNHLVPLTILAFSTEDKVNIIVRDKQLASIAIETQPIKTRYAIEEEKIVLDGAGLRLTFDDTSTETIAINSDMISGFIPGAVGTQTITVTYEDKICHLYITVCEVSAISIKTRPSKTKYVQGQSISSQGGILTVTYSDGTDEDLPLELAELDYPQNTTGNVQVTAKYLGFITSFAITVNDRIVKSITIESEPSKSIYFIGEKLDLAGGTLKVVFESDDNYYEIIPIDESMVLEFDSTKTGYPTITISYEGKTDDFLIRVREYDSSLTQISLTCSNNEILVSAKQVPDFAVVYVAQYDINGRMLSLQTVYDGMRIEKEKDLNQTFAFLWNKNNMSPYREKITLK